MSAPAIATRMVYSLEDLARIFRRSTTTISSHVARLMKEHGFPQPLPLHRPRLWSRHQVLKWISDGGFSAGAHLTPAEDPRLSPEAIAAGRARLEGRYGGRA